MRLLLYRSVARCYLFTIALIPKVAVASAAPTWLAAWGGGAAANAPQNVSNVAAVACGNAALALGRDGTVQALGRLVPSNAPAAATNVIAIAADGTAVLLRRDGTVINWTGQVQASNAVAVVAAQSYGAGALRRDGALNWLGGYLSLPPVRTNIAALFGGRYATVDPLYADGSVWSAGIPTDIQRTLTNVVSIARTAAAGVWLKSDGSVVSSLSTSPYPLPELTNAVAIAAAAAGGLALRADGTLAAWGDPSLTNLAPTLSNIVAIAAGDRHALALRSDGTVVAWGDNSAGQTNVPPQLTNVAAIFAAGSASFAIVGESPPTLLSRLPDEITWAGRAATFVVRAVGTAPLRFQWQRNGEIIEGATNFFYRIERTTPADSGVYSLVVSNPRGTALSEALLTVRDDPFFLIQPTNQAVIYGGNATFRASALGSQPATYQWFFNGQAIAGATTASLVVTNIDGPHIGQYWVVASNAFGVRTSAVATLTPLVLAAWGDNYYLVPTNLQEVAAITAGVDDYFVLKPDGTIAGWGECSRHWPSITPGFSNIVAIAAGDDYLLGLLENGTMLEAGSVANRGTPMPALFDVVAISVGWYHSLALRAGSSVEAWGGGIDGQTSVPAGLTNVVSIAAGGCHSLALRANGSVVAWGYNAYLQTNVPPGLHDIVAIAAGGHHSLALRQDGTVVAWGDNYYGQTNVPAGLLHVIAVAAGTYHSLALHADGTVVSWGHDPDSAAIANLHNVVAIAASGYHSLALVAAGLCASTPVLSHPGWSQGAFSLRVQAWRGKTYYLQHRASLSDPDWHLLIPIPGDNSIRTLSDPAASLPQGFYRVWQKPGP